MKFYHLIFLSLLFSCTNKSKSNSITLNTLEIDTTFNIKIDKAYPTTLKIKITGNSNDTFGISGFKIPGGMVDTFWHVDWYQKNIIIKYESYKAKSGQLKIEYQVY